MFPTLAATTFAATLATHASIPTVETHASIPTVEIAPNVHLPFLTMGDVLDDAAVQVVRLVRLRDVLPRVQARGGGRAAVLRRDLECSGTAVNLTRTPHASCAVPERSAFTFARDCLRVAALAEITSELAEISEIDLLRGA